MNLKAIILISAILISSSAFSQKYTQTIRGTITDRDSKLPVIGANVILVGSSPVVGTISDENGNFKLINIPLGRQNISISFIGYNNVEIPNILVSSGKEIVLDISMIEKVTEMNEVVVKAPVRKEKPMNEMVVVSARSFTVEETEKYAGSRGDVARMASNYAGVSFANDQRNDIIIRGNSPTGLLWRLEEIDIPNPNHFAENGTTGGPVGMLNNNVLKNSDFLTGAFPAEYGNALSGVFDLRMRNGNNEKHEQMFQCGFNGFELGFEGPFKTGHSSYLANFRYSTLEVLDKMGVSVGTSGVPKYMDGTFKFNIPLKKGNISWFALAGKSQISMLYDRKKKNLYVDEGQDTYSKSDMIASGLTFSYFISSKSNLKLIYSGFKEGTNSQVDTLDLNYTAHRVADHQVSDYKLSLSAIFHTKYSAKLNTKAGISVDRMGYDLNTKSFDNDSSRLISRLNNSKSLSDGPDLFRSFIELSYKFTEQLSFNPGFHLMYFDLNDHISLEPRLGVAWRYGTNKSINAGFGIHSRLQTLPTYYYGTHSLQSFTIDNQVVCSPKYSETNKNLGFTKAYHFILCHDWSISKDLRLKTESYYQYLYDVPVETRKTLFSTLNKGVGWGFSVNDSLVNKGKGYNYGLEFTFEKFLSRNYYFLITTSLFDSKYRGSDDTLRNTEFNGNYVCNFLLGYEIKISQDWSVAFDAKTTIAGGKRYIPINITKSSETEETEYDFYRAYKYQYPEFLKCDFKITIRQNGRRFSQEWQLYMENITDHANIFNESYSRAQKRIIRTYQLGRFPGSFPMVNYRLNF